MSFRVAIVGDVPADRYGVLGGVQSTTYYLIEGLGALREADIHVITLDYRSGQDAVRQESGVTFHRLATPPRWGLVTSHAAARARVGRLLAEIEPDVVHGIGTGVHAYVALRSGYPAVLTVHGIQREDAKYMRGARNRLHAWLQGVLIERYCIARARHVILITPYLLQAIPELRQAQTYHIPNPVAGSYFDLVPATDPTRIFYAGVITPRKRLLEALMAVARVRRAVPGVTIRFAGAVTDPLYYQELQRYIAEQGMESCVTFLGALPVGQLAEEFRRCALLLLTSAQETAPMVIAEAMASAKAVIATRVGGVPDLMEDGVTGILTRPGSIDETAAALERLLGNPQECAAMGQRGREFARAHFSVEAAAAETLRVYRMVAGEQQNRGN